MGFTLGAPCGTIAEIEELGLNPLVVPTCAPYMREKQIGCPAYNFCNLAERGKSGPIYVAAKQFVMTQNGARSSVDVKPCFHAMLIKQMLETNGGLLKIVGREGDTVQVPGSKKVYPKGPDGTTVAGEPKWEKCEFDVKVERFPRPGELEEFQTIVALRALQAERAKEQETEREATFIAVATGRPDAPADGNTGKGSRK